MEFLKIESANDLSIGWKFRIEYGWAEKVQGNVTLFNKFSPLWQWKWVWVDAITDRKWYFQILFDFLEELRECFTFDVNWYATSLKVMNYFRRLEN